MSIKRELRFPEFFSFRSKILCFFIIVSLFVMGGGFAVIIFGLPFLGFQGEQTRYLNDAFQNLSSIADLKKEFLIRWMEERKGDARVIAESEWVEDQVGSLGKRIATARYDELQPGEYWSSLQQTQESRQLNQYLRNVKNEYGYYERIQIADIGSRRIIASSEKEDIGLAIPPANFVEGLEFQGFVLRFQKDFQDRDHDLVLLLPIREISSSQSWRKPLAVLRLQIKPDTIVLTMPDIGGSLGKTSEVYLVDNQRRNLTALKHPYRGRKVTEPMTVKLDTKGAAFAADGREGLIVAEEYSGVRSVAAYRHIQVTSDFGFGIVVKQDTSEAFHYLISHLRYQSIIFLVFMGVIIILFSTAAKWLFRPVEALGETARRIEAGDFSARAPEGGHDELGKLVDVFNGMAGKIEQWHKNLEDEVSRRTQELFAANAKLVKENTARKQAEDELRASEERFRRAIVEAPIPIMIHVDNGEVLQISKAWTELTGYRQEDIPTLAEWLQKAHGELSQSVQEVISRFYTQHVQNQCGEYDVRTATGEHRIWDFSSALLGRFVDGRQMVISIAQDVTERRQIEDALRESEERYRQIVELSPNVIFIQCEGKIAFINDEGVRFFGAQMKEELIGKAVLDLVYSEDRDVVAERISVLRRGAAIPHNEERFIRLNGTPVWVDASAVAFIYNGKPAAQVMLVDVSQRKEAERLLKEKIIALTQPLGDVSGLKFADLFDVAEIQAIQDAFAEATGVASLITDRDGRPLTEPSRFNKLCSEVIRATPDGLANCMRSDALIGGENIDGPIIRPCLGCGLLDGGTSIRIGDYPIAHWLIGQVMDETADPEAMVAYAREIGADEDVFRRELANIPHMPRRQFEEICQALFLIAKQLSTLAVQNIQQAREIARRYQAEEEIQQLNLELEERVKIRTSQLEASNKELETFSYSVSHDLRAPLRAIEGYGQMLLEDCNEQVSDEGRRYIRVMRKNTQRMARLIDDLLAFSRMSRKTVDKSIINMNQLFGSVIEELREEDPQLKTVFEIGALPPVYGDAAMIHQVLFNLVGNAVKFSGKKERPVVEIGSFVRDHETVYYIKDNGVGFNMQYADKLFGVFQRLHGMDEFEGTGVGLAIAAKIIQRHAGRIWAEAQEDQGAIFYFVLPETNKDN